MGGYHVITYSTMNVCESGFIAMPVAPFVVVNLSSHPGQTLMGNLVPAAGQLMARASWRSVRQRSLLEALFSDLQPTEKHRRRCWDLSHSGGLQSYPLLHSQLLAHHCP